ncbi:hypothetical protein SJPD1_1044 [Sulfurospirillum diekertiae]|uniref:Uncharacterized protein n=2 Tax=Sulfurospirillum diekertiae TaxID=1854492 RepID=A0A290HTK3_9BACT|nr:hypothetical protein SJPD1_1044 [Sulfurospirillum diekertiae]
MFEQELNVKRNQRVHSHVMRETLFISLLAMYPMAKEDGIKSYSTQTTDRGSYDKFYHYSVDKNKRQKIELWNKKYALNSCF